MKSAIYKIILPLLFLGFFNFLGRGTYVLLFAFVGILILKKAKVIYGTPLMLSVLLWTVCYVLWVSYYYSLTSVRNMLVPLTAFLAFWSGQHILPKENKTYYFKTTLMAAALGAGLYGLGNMFVNIQRYGWSFGGIRTMADIWKSGDILATGQYALFIPAVAGLYYYIRNFKNEKKIIGIICILIPFIGIIYTVMTASRFILYITVIEVVLLTIVEALKQKKPHVVVSLGLAFFAIVVILRFNILGLADLWNGSDLIQRINRLESGGLDTAFSSTARTEQVKLVLHNFSLFLKGGYPTNLPFIHNTWLDVLNSGGLLVALPFLLMTVVALFKAVRIAFANINTIGFLIMGFLITTYAYFYIEPLLEGARWLYYLFLFVMGIVDTFGSDSEIHSVPMVYKEGIL